MCFSPRDAPAADSGLESSALCVGDGLLSVQLFPAGKKDVCASDELLNVVIERNEETTCSSGIYIPRVTRTTLELRARAMPESRQYTRSHHGKRKA